MGVQIINLSLFLFICIFSAIHFLLSIDLSVSHKFQYNLIFIYFISLDTFWFMYHLEMCCLVSKCLDIFLCPFYYWFPVCSFLEKEYSDFNSLLFFDICFMPQDMVYVQQVSKAWKKFALLLLDGAFWLCHQLDSIDWWC